MKTAICSLLMIINVQGYSQDLTSFLDKYVSSKSKCNTLEYDVHFINKIYSRDDTSYFNASVKVQRLPSDSVFGGLISMDLDSLWFGYNGQYVFKGHKSTSVLEIADPIQMPGALLQNTWANNLIDYSFLRNYAGLKEDVLKNNEYISTKDTLLNNEPCFSILYTFPDVDGFSNMWNLYIISKQDYFMRKRITSSYFQDNQQYHEFTYQNHQCYKEEPGPEFVNRNKENFSNHTFLILSETSAEAYFEYNYKSLIGSNLGDGTAIHLSQIQDTIIILDFWYSSCYPCIQSIPIVDRLAKEFAGKVLFFGVNPIDDLRTDKARLHRFRKNNIMTYPTIMVDKELTKDMPRVEYPTIVLLDKTGKTVYVESGLDNLSYGGLKEQIEKHLK